MRWTRNLSELDRADLPAAGGKAANLGVLIRGGMPVPPGFCVLTAAYAEFVGRNGLAAEIDRIRGSVERPDAAALETAAGGIRDLFLSHPIPEDIASAVAEAYRGLDPAGSAPVAVRSSATAEDLPDLSFAGQQETILNVVGADALLRSVVECWASLWTARAIGYRMRNAVPAEGLALAVAVQRMVPSECSGVLFTADPLTGNRKETVIDAAFGLGEALVSGKVEPDHYVVRTAEEKILSKAVGAKALRILPAPGGGTETVRAEAQPAPALSDAEIVSLTRLGARARALFPDPQDIEWARAGGEFFLLQSRPITSLFPTPARLPEDPLHTLFSFAAVQGMLDPMTPLGRDSLALIFAAGATLFGVRVTPETQRVLYEAGERLWVDFTPVLRNPIGRRMVPYVLAMVEPTIGRAVRQIQDEPDLQPGRGSLSLRAALALGRFLPRLGFNALRNLADPRRRREQIVENGERLLAAVESRLQSISGSRGQRLEQIAGVLPALAADRLPDTFILFVSGVAAGMAAWNWLSMLADRARKDPQGRAEMRDLLLQVTRGMPYNPTTEMDLALWDLAKAVRSDPESARAFAGADAAGLARRYLGGTLPDAADRAIGSFLGLYGGRGLGEIDLGRTRWTEDPTHVFEMVLNFLEIRDAFRAPDAVFARGARSAEEAVAALAAAVRRTRNGRVKARLVRFLAGRARQLMGARESPKFFAVRMMYKIHRELLAVGREYAAAGGLERADDLFFLRFAELRAFAAGADRPWREIIAERRRAYEREFGRRQVPRLLLTDGRAFYEGLGAESGDARRIVGSPVSPGRAEGRVRVVLDPRQARLEPGEILVCPGTDPSWTPLFLSAGALVMEVGGMMTHGSVVAREYGIPGVVGVHNATGRLKTGQRVRVDGSRGIIEIIGDGK